MKSLISFAVFFAVLASLPAALTLTSENFTGKGGNPSGGHWFSITGWTESNTTINSFADFGLGTGSSAINDAGGDPNTTVTPGIGPDGYLYASIGTRGNLLADTSALNITGVNYFRAAAGQGAPLVISIYSAPSGAFAPPDGTAIGASGATLLSSQTFGSGTATQSFNLNFSLAGIGADENIIVHFSKGTGGSFAYVDTLTFALVPEPSAALFGGLGMLALLRRRRP